MRHGSPVVSGRASDLPIRVLSAAVGIVVVLGAVAAGLWPLAVLVAVAAAWAAGELMVLAVRAGQSVATVLGVAAAASFPLAAAALGESGLGWMTLAAVAATVLWLLVSREASLPGAAITLLGALYVGMLLGHLLLLRRLEDGTVIVLVAFVGTWVADTGAYGIGTAFGRHKLAPAVSPRKTWEGTIGGLMITVALFAAARFLDSFTVAERAALGAIIAVAATLGDLIESKVKRLSDVKDSGHLIPGHGGVLDRFDSLILVAPALYVAVAVIGWLR